VNRSRNALRDLSATVAVLSTLGGSLAGCTRVPTGPEAEAAADAFMARQPVYLRPFPYTPVPAGLPDLRPETCGGCHREIYEEWRVSTHARAWEDPQFQAELDKQRGGGTGAGGADSSWMCVNCHIPLVNQHETRVVGLKGGALDRPVRVPNPRFQPDLVDSAIGCAACHVRGGVVYGPTGDTEAPHPVAKDPDLLTPAVCERCHEAEAFFPELDLACVFRTGTEFRAGPYDDEGKVCQTCHMPAALRPLVAGGAPRPTRRHWFGGSMLPKRPEYEAEIAPLRAFYPDGLTVELASPPARLAPGEPARVEWVVTNAEAGHSLPTGDPERYLEVTLRARGADGRPLAERTERIGARYQWYPDVKLLSDNRLAPRESRTYALGFVAPPSGAVVLEVAAARFRLSPEDLAFHRLDGLTVAGRFFLPRTWRVPVGVETPSASPSSGPGR